MKTEIIKEGNIDVLVIRVPLNAPPVASSTGKSLIVASTSGFFKPGLSFLGKAVSISLDIIVPNK